MKRSVYPPGWNEDRVKKVIDHYKKQSEEECVAEDEAVYEDSSYTMMEVPKELVPKIRELIARRAS